MTEHRAEFHQPSTQEDALPVLDVLAGEYHRAVFREDDSRDRRARNVRPVGEEPEDEEAEEDDEGGPLDPRLRNEELATGTCCSLPGKHGPSYQVSGRGGESSEGLWQ